MRILLSFCVLALVLFLSGCSDDTVSPDNNGNNNGGNDSSSFVIVAVDKDTVLWEDTVTVTLKHVHSDSLKLFIHTVPVTLDSSWSEAQGNAGIRFIVPANTSTGLIRVFEHDTVQAKGEFSLVVRERRRSSIDIRASSFFPSEGYTDDLVAIFGTDFDFAENINIFVGLVQLPIVKRTNEALFLRIPAAMQTGTLMVKIDGRTTAFELLTKLEVTGSLTLNGSSKQILFHVSGLHGVQQTVNVKGPDTVISTNDIMPQDMSFVYSMVLTKSSGDSLFFTSLEGSALLDMRLKLEPENRVSGTMRLEQQLGSYNQLVELVVKDLRWKFVNGHYIFLAYSLDLPNELREFHMRSGDPFQWQETSGFDGSDETAGLLIDVR